MMAQSPKQDANAASAEFAATRVSTLEHPGSLFKTINTLLERDANNALRLEGLTISQITTLMVIHEAGDAMSMKQLEGALFLSQPTITGLVKRLEAKKLLSASADPEDARVKQLSLTDEGRRCCETARVKVAQTDARVLDGFSPEEQAEFIGFLKRVIANIQNG